MVVSNSCCKSRSELQHPWLRLDQSFTHSPVMNHLQKCKSHLLSITPAIYHNSLQTQAMLKTTQKKTYNRMQRAFWLYNMTSHKSTYRRFHTERLLNIPKTQRNAEILWRVQRPRTWTSEPRDNGSQEQPPKGPKNSYFLGRNRRLMYEIKAVKQIKVVVSLTYIDDYFVDVFC